MLKARNVSDVLMPLFNHGSDALVHSAMAGNDQRTECGIRKCAVHQHNGKIFRHGIPQGLEAVRRAGHQKPVHHAAGQGANTVQFVLLVFPGVGNNQLVRLAGHRALYLFDQSGKVLVGNIRHNKTDQFLFSGF